MMSLGKVLNLALSSTAPVEGPVPTLFEIDLRQKYLSLQCMGFSYLIINLRTHNNVEGYDFDYYGVPCGVDVRRYIKCLPNPAVVMDLGRPFEDHWPPELVGNIHQPRELGELFSAVDISYRAPEAIVHISHFQHR
jgi:hypothetical protein